MKDGILIFTDGACSGNPGPGGFGTVVVNPFNKTVFELGEGFNSTTNNQMEMLAVIRGLEELKDFTHKIYIISDSTYVIRGITQWIFGWKKRAWKTAENNDVSNKDLWMRLDALVQKRKVKNQNIEWKYVRGHQGVPGNERCDEIAVNFTKGRSEHLYDGNLSNYSIDIYQLPQDMSLPKFSSNNKAKSTADVVYLSYVNGELKKHKTWSECEANVKGRSGAKFKKVKNKDEELAVLKSWGLE
ncbi:MAG: ribonuclease HI [Bdellovibrionales bacterium]|nr:ribonuclease HI [Bdellovibrionales bacterium]